MSRRRIKHKPKHKDGVCVFCGCRYPIKWIMGIVMDKRHYPACPYCVNAVAPMHMKGAAMQVYQEFSVWIYTEKGRWYKAINEWNNPNLQNAKNENDKEKQHMITTVCRLSYCNTEEPSETPSGDMKYSTSALVPMSDTKGVDEINKAIHAAIAKGIETGKFNKAQAKNLRLPLRNGTKEHEAGDRGVEYKGHYFFNASSKTQPGMVGPDAKPLMDLGDIYSGCYGRLDVNFFPYNVKGNRGIGVGLNNIMKVRDGDRLDGRQKAEDAFGSFAEEDVADEQRDPADME